MMPRHGGDGRGLGMNKQGFEIVVVRYASMEASKKGGTPKPFISYSRNKWLGMPFPLESFKPPFGLVCLENHMFGGPLEYSPCLGKPFHHHRGGLPSSQGAKVEHGRSCEVLQRTWAVQKLDHA